MESMPSAISRRTALELLGVPAAVSVLAAPHPAPTSADRIVASTRSKKSKGSRLVRLILRGDAPGIGIYGSNSRRHRGTDSAP